MAAVLQFRSDVRRTRRGPEAGGGVPEDDGRLGEVIIFPGVRIERAGLDLSHRLVRVAAPAEGLSGLPAGKS